MRFALFKREVRVDFIHYAVANIGKEGIQRWGVCVFVRTKVATFNAPLNGLLKDYASPGFHFASQFLASFPQ